MSKPMFLLTKKVPLTLHRRTQGSYVDGDWIEGSTVDVVIQANVQPLKDYELLQLPESERSRDWQKVYSAEMMLTQVQGQQDADEFEWESMEDGQTYTYKIMKVRRYKMGILDHWRAFAARKEITPN